MLLGHDNTGIAPGAGRVPRPGGTYCSEEPQRLRVSVLDCYGPLRVQTHAAIWAFFLSSTAGLVAARTSKSAAFEIHSKKLRECWVQN